MPCNQIEDRLHGYLDGELDAAGAAEFERHLQACSQCSTALSAEQALRGALAKAHLYEHAPASLISAVRTQIVLPASSAKERAAYWKWLAIAASILFVISSGILTLTLLRSRRGVPELAIAAVDAHLRSLQPGHLADVPSSDQHTVKPWFDGRVDFAPAVVDFANEGFPLLGGRLDVLNGKTVAALVYGRRKHIINVFIAPRGTADLQAGAGEIRGYHWLAWQDVGFDYVAVTDAVPSDLADLRSLFAAK